MTADDFVVVSQLLACAVIVLAFIWLLYRASKDE